MAKVIISGGGISGLCLGIALKKQNIPYIILEKSKQYDRNIKRIGGGIGLWGPALKALRVLGVEEKLHGKQLTCAGYRTSHQLTSQQWLVKPSFDRLNRHTSCLCLRRGELQNKLLDSIDQDTIKLNSEVKSIQQTSTNVIVHLHNGETVTGSMLVGADGVDSVTRQTIFPSISPSSCGYFYWQGIGTLPSPGSTSIPAYEAWHPGIRFGVVPLPDSECFWFICSDKDISPSSKTLNHILSQLISPFGSEAISLVSNTDPASIYQAHLRDVHPPSGKWSNGRIVCIGDSIHAMAPNLAQGACLAIEDAMELAHQIGSIDQTSASLEDIERIFQLFTRNRQKRTQLVQFLVPLVHKMGSMSLPYTFYRNICFQIFPDFFKTIIFDTTHRIALGWSYTPPNLYQGLYHRLLSSTFLQKYSFLSLFHAKDRTRYCSGSLQVTVSDSRLIQILLFVLSLPSSNITYQHGYLTVEMISSSTSNNNKGYEIWNRTFINQKTKIQYHFNTTQTIHEEMLKETFYNFMTFYFNILEQSNSNTFLLILHDFTLEFSFFSYEIHIPIPSIFHPCVVGKTMLSEDKDMIGWDYEVDITLPKWCQKWMKSTTSRILKYEGRINQCSLDEIQR